MTTLAQNKNVKQNIFKKNHLPPKKGAVRSNQLVFYFLHLHPEKENTASVHSGPFQRIHAPQQQRRVTWRWIFVSADGSGGCDFCLARRGVCNMDGFFLKSAQQKNTYPLGIQGIVPGKVIRMLGISSGIGTLHRRYPSLGKGIGYQG